MHTLQLPNLHKIPDQLQKKFGNPDLNAIYGAGQIHNPKFLLLFMNPTGRNVSATPDWEGLRAPWLGTKNIWKMIYSLDLIDKNLYYEIQSISPNLWSPSFCQTIYQQLSANSVYITNLAKCTQIDARALHDKVFHAYLENTLQEIYEIAPQKIISFGNQVSSILLGKKIQVSAYQNMDHENLKIKDRDIPVFPVYYPVGQGMRNLPKAIERINFIHKNFSQ